MALKRVNFADIITFTRATEKTGFQLVPDGFGGTKIELQTFASGVPAVPVYDPSTGQPLGLSVHEQRTNFNLWSNDLSKLNLVSTGDFTPPVASFDQEIFGRPASKVTFSTGTTGYSRVNLTTRARVDGEFYTIKFCAKSLSGTQELVVGIAGIGNTVVTVTEQEQVFEVPVEWNIAGGTFPASVGQTPAQLRTTGEFVIGFLQDEDGSFGTSLIETNGFTATRNADVAVINNINTLPFWNPSEGTFVVEFKAESSGGYKYSMALSDGTTSNRIIIGKNSGTENAVVRLIETSDPSPVNIATFAGTDVSTGVRLAFSFASGGIRASANGSAIQSSGAVSLLPLINKLNIGANSTGGSEFLNGTIKDILYYPTALSDAKLQELSTL